MFKHVIYFKLFLKHFSDKKRQNMNETGANCVGFVRIETKKGIKYPL